MRIITKTAGLASCILVTAGAILKNLQLAGAGQALGWGFMIFIGVFSPLFLKDRLSMEMRRAAKMSYGVFFLASVLLMLALLFKSLHLPGSEPLTYLAIISFIVYILFFSSPEMGRKLKLQKDRQLAAVLFTDMVGFTSLMGRNEDQALRFLDKNRLVQKKWARKYRGKWLKDVGDGSILIFYTASEAVQCAVRIQEAINKLRSFDVRMGIHISEILFTDTDVFGDGVNVASRISGQAGAGEICISGPVYQNVINRENHQIEELGSIQLKNVEYPMDLYKIKSAADNHPNSAIMT